MKVNIELMSAYVRDQLGYFRVREIEALERKLSREKAERLKLEFKLTPDQAGKLAVIQKIRDEFEGWVVLSEQKDGKIDYWLNSTRPTMLSFGNIRMSIDIK